MSIFNRNGARLFEPGRGGGSAPEVTPNTQLLCHFQPRMPWVPSTVNGDALVDESGNIFDLSLDVGTNNLFAPGPVPGSYSLYFNGSTIFNRAYDAALYILGDATLEAYLKCEDIAWPANVDVMGFSGQNIETEAENYNLVMGIDSSQRHPKYFHEGAAGLDQSFTWTDVSLPVQEWVYVAMVRDATAMTVTLYINGVAHPTVYNYTSNAVGGTGTTFAVGGNTEFNVNIFQGWLAGVRIRDAAASAEDIAATWRRINPNDPSNLREPELLPEISPANHASVTMWHEAGQHDTDDGDSVTTPTLLAGANGVTQATAAERPLIVTAGGAPGWKMFDDVSQGKWFDGAALSNYIAANGYHVFCALTLYGADQNSGTLYTNHRIFGDDAGWWGMYARRDAGVNSHFGIYGYHWDGAAKTPGTEPVSRHEIHLVEFWYDTGTLESVFRMDNGAESRVAAGNIGSLANVLEVGGNSADEFQGVIHSLMIANAYDAARAQGIRNHYANKYRLHGRV